MALPALEYCNLDRASRLLNCEINDIIHWWLVGIIELHVCLDGKQAIIIGSEKENLEVPVADALKALFEGSLDLPSSKLSILKKRRCFDYDLYPKNKCYLCEVYGLWRILPSSITRELPDNKVKLISESYFRKRKDKNGLALLSHDIDNYYLVFNEIDNMDGWEIDVKDLIITKKYINKLDPSINQNVQEFPNLLSENNFEDEKNIEQTAEITKIKEKVSSKLKDAFTILLKEANCHTEKPYKLYNLLNSVAEKHGYPKDHFKEETCANWVKQSNPKLGK